MNGGGSERERERIPTRLHIASAEPDAGLKLTTVGSRHELKSGVGCLTDWATQPPPDLHFKPWETCVHITGWEALASKPRNVFEAGTTSCKTHCPVSSGFLHRTCSVDAYWKNKYKLWTQMAFFALMPPKHLPNGIQAIVHWVQTQVTVCMCSVF